MLFSGTEESNFKNVYIQFLSSLFPKSPSYLKLLVFNIGQY